MPAKKRAKGGAFSHLKKFLKQNSRFDPGTAALSDPEVMDALNWKGLTGEKAKILEQLAAYQRLLSIVPEGHADLALALMEAGITAALQIAAMPKPRFLADYAHLTGEKELLDSCYQNALAVRARLLLLYIDKIQQNSTI